MSKDKYYGTTADIPSSIQKAIQALAKGKLRSKSQFRVVCKTTSYAKANEIASSFGLRHDTFHKNYTSLSGNEKEMKAADNSAIVVNLSNNDDEFLRIEDIVEMAQKIREIEEKENAR